MGEDDRRRGEVAPRALPLVLVLSAFLAGILAQQALAVDEIDSRLLERYAPVLVYDADETLHAQPVSLPPGEPEVRPGDRAYGYVATEGEDTWLQYWLFYADNPQDRHPLGTGRHEGDWELIQLRLGASGKPDLATLSQHSWAEGCWWSELETQFAAGAEVPRIYVANASHANYSRAGDYRRPFPDATDEADGAGPTVRPPVSVITDERPAWVTYPGRWGETEASFIPGEAPSPRGPRFQESGAWQSPSTYHESLARSCGSGAPGRWWQTAAGAVVVVGAVGGGVILLRRRRRRQ